MTVDEIEREHDSVAVYHLIDCEQIHFLLAEVKRLRDGLMVNELELKDFLDTVAAMRKAQRGFFASRAKPLLDESRRLEAVVDMRIKELFAKLEEEQQPRLL